MDHRDLLYECAGINHIAWMTRLEVEGEDAYPRLFAAMENPEVYARDKVRFELMRRFGYFVTESSEHNAEYTPYFLRDDDLIDIYDVPVDEYVRRSEENLVEYAETRRKLLSGEDFHWSAASSTARSSSTPSSRARRAPSTATSRTRASSRTSPKAAA